MLFFQDALSEDIFVIMVKNRHIGLDDDRSRIHTIIDKMDGAPSHLYSVEKGLVLGMETGESGKEGGVDVHHPPTKVMDDSRTKDSHIAGKNVEVSSELVQDRKEGLFICIFGGI